MFKDVLSRLQFLPLIAYGSVTLGSTSLGNTERISKLQKRASRIILHAEYTTLSVDTVVPTKSDSYVIFCLHSNRDLK